MKTLKYIFLAIMFFTLIKVNAQNRKTSNQWFDSYIEYCKFDTKEYKDELNHFDFASLFLNTPTGAIFGVIGDEMQRIRMKLISVNKDPYNPDSYYVYGKSNVKGNVCEYTGIIKIKTIRLYQKDGFDMPYRSTVNPQKIGVLFCDYILAENKEQKHTGVFKGISATEFYINNDTLFYNNLRNRADDFTNNQFVGIWENYDNQNSRICNWGDYRIPEVYGFDCGAAQFAPCSEFFDYGWADYYKAIFHNDTEAAKREYFKWW